MKKIPLKLTFEEIELMFKVCQRFAGVKTSVKSSSCMYALLAEKSVELHKRTYIYSSGTKKTTINFKVSEALAFIVCAPMVFASHAIWERNKVNEWIAYFDQKLA